MTADRIIRVSRGVALGVLAMVAVGSLTACNVPFFPSRPNNQPMAMTVRDGEVWFQWCGDGTVGASFLAVDFNVFASEPLRGVAVEGEGRFRIGPGTEFSTSTPPPGGEYTLSTPIPITDEVTSVWVYTGSARDDLNGLKAGFRIDSLSGLGEGQWLHPSGEVSDRACGD